MVYPKVHLVSTLPSGHAQTQERDRHRSQRERVIASLVLHPARPSGAAQPYVNPNRGIY